MKKLFILGLMAVCAYTASAQVWVGGTLGFTSSTRDSNEHKLHSHPEYSDNNKNIDVSTFNLNPTVGYDLNEKFSIALACQYSYTGSTTKVYGTTDESSAHAIAVNPFVRYHFASCGDVRFFVDGGVSVGKTFVKNVDHNATNFSAGFTPGLSYRFNDRVSLVANLGGLGWKNSSDGDDESSSFFFNLHNSVSFGFYINL